MKSLLVGFLEVHTLEFGAFRTYEISHHSVQTNHVPCGMHVAVFRDAARADELSVGQFHVLNCSAVKAYLRRRNESVKNPWFAIRVAFEIAIPLGISIDALYAFMILFVKPLLNG